MAELRATPYANPLTGLSNDVIQGLLGYMKDKRRTQQLQGLGNLLESTGIPKTVERAAYAESPTGLLNALTNVNRANVPLLKPETADALMTLAPVPSGANKAAMAAGRAGERYAERVVPQIMERGGLPAEMVQAMGSNTRSLLDVYHGTPHTLPPTAKNPLGEFDASKIGTGEGAQSFGHGIYVAEAPALAKEYQRKLSGVDVKLGDINLDEIINTSKNSKEVQAAQRLKNDFLNNAVSSPDDISNPKFIKETVNYYKNSKTPESEDVANLFDKYGSPSAELKGNLYKVDLPDEKIATMLDWDLPLSKQSPQVQAAIEKLTGLKADTAKMGEYEDALLNALQGGSTDLPKQPLDPLGVDLYAKFISGGNEAAARKLQELGISGVKYLDEFSRKEGKGTRNFVLFPSEEKSLTILERNGLLADQFQALPEEKKKEILSLLE